MLDLSVVELAPHVNLAAGSLKNIESNQPRAVVSRRLVLRAVEAFAALRAGSDRKSAQDVPAVTFDDLVDKGAPSAHGDETPDDPPSKEQQDETNRGPGRDGSGGTGPGKAGKTSPKRARGVAA